MTPRPTWPNDAQVRALVERLTQPLPPARVRKGKSRKLTRTPQQATLPTTAEEPADADLDRR